MASASASTGTSLESGVPISVPTEPRATAWTSMVWLKVAGGGVHSVEKAPPALRDTVPIGVKVAPPSVLYSKRTCCTSEPPEATRCTVLSVPSFFDGRATAVRGRRA